MLRNEYSLQPPPNPLALHIFLITPYITKNWNNFFADRPLQNTSTVRILIKDGTFLRKVDAHSFKTLY